MKALVIPAMITTALIIIQPEKPSVTFLMISVLVQWVILTMLAVTIHRIVLLGPNSVKEWSLYFPGSRELSFFINSFLIGLILIPVGLTSLIPGIGEYVSVIVGVYIIGRLSLVFPSIATDSPLSISDSWSATQGHKVLMLVVVAVFPITLSIPELVIARIPSVEFSIIVANILSLVAMVFIVAALSESYRLIEGQFIES